MAATPAAIAPDGEPVAWMLPGVKLFASGEYRGKKWPPAAIRMIAANARRLGPSGERLLVPPSVLGHEEPDEQDWLNRTDLPACGWVDPDSAAVAPDPDHPGELILTGDVVNIPDVVKREKLDTGEFRYGSAEIYDDFKNDFGRSYGKALRRFALLGGEVPQVKRLGCLPKPVPMAALKTFSENARRVFIREKRVRVGGAVHTYAETVSMDRQQMIAALRAAMPGLSQATLDPLSDEQLADLVKNLPAPVAPAAPAAPAAPVPPSGMMADMSHDDLIKALTDLGQDPAELEGMSDEELQALLDELSAADADAGAPTEDMGDPATMSREEIVAELVAAGQDPAQLDAMSDEDLRALYTQVVGAATASAPAAPAAPPPAAAMSERARRARAAAFSETRKVIANAKRLNAEMERELRRVQVANLQQKRQDAEAFCDRLVSEGKILPAQRGDYLSVLVPLDNTKRLHKFTEAGQTRMLSAYDLKKAELAKRAPIVRFGERLPKDPNHRPDGEAEVAKVRAFAERLPDAALKAGGYTREQFVEKFSETAKKRPGLTAKEYLGPTADV